MSLFVKGLPYGCAILITGKIRITRTQFRKDVPTSTLAPSGFVFSHIFDGVPQNSFGETGISLMFARAARVIDNIATGANVIRDNIATR